ncbi:MAG: cohesin domain-containing protein [Terriglobales bacterium]
MTRPSLALSVLCLLAVLLVGAAPRLHAADKGEPYYRHGEMSMAANNYDQAYVDFKKAMELSPDNIEYQIATHHAQFAAANAHIQQAEKLKGEKKYPEALAQIQLAARIDPANFVAGQEMQAIENILHPPPPPPGEGVGAEQVDTLQQRLARAAGPVELGPLANTLIKDFTVNTDPKNAYLAAGKLAGLNVIFDNSGAGGGYSNTGRVSLELHNLTMLQILRVLDVQTNSFYTPITPNTILVATNSQQNHEQVDPTVLKVFYIKNVQQATDLTELAQAIRGLMQPQPHLMPVPAIDALVMRDTPDKVAMVQKVLDDLDKMPPEVVVDVRILQVNRDRARDLGFLPPTSFGLGLQAPQTSTSASSSTTTGTTTTPTTNAPTLNELTHLNSSNFSVTIPNATLNALLSDSSTETVQEPELRAIQGQKAELQIGEKIPVATGSFQPGVGGVGINPLVNTQFNFEQVGVIINMTPQIEGDSTVLLKEHIEISSVNSYTSIGGIQQPIIGNNIIDHTIELSNGQSTALGGLMVNTVTHNVQGLPFVSEVPVFKWLFSSTHDETVHSEILIVLTPHIVHRLNITPQDLQALYTGTQNNVQLRELPATTAAPGAAAATPEPAAQPAAAGPAVAATGGEPELAFTPPASQARTGQKIQVQLELSHARDAYAMSFQLNYDPRVLQVDSIQLGGFLKRGGAAPALVHREDAVSGTAQVSLSRPAGAAGLSGSGPVLTITFTAKAPGRSTLALSRLGARGPKGEPQNLASVPATVVVQ